MSLLLVWARPKCFFSFLIHFRPSPTITWKKDGQEILDDQNSFKISRSFYGRRLFIHNVDKEQHEGTYTCEAENDLNTGSPLSFNITLSIEGKRPRTARPPSLLKISRENILCCTCINSAHKEQYDVLGLLLHFTVSTCPETLRVYILMSITIVTWLCLFGVSYCLECFW